MIHRTYIVMFPTPAFGSSTLDIVLSLPGSKGAPVSVNGSLVPPITRTAPPPGWNGVDGAYYEWRGLPIDVDSLFGASDFTPAGRLGWKIAVEAINTSSIGQAPEANPTQSITGTIGGNGGMPDVTIADPPYGPSIRLSSGDASIGQTVWAVHFDLHDAKDEDRSPNRH